MMLALSKVQVLASQTVFLTPRTTHYPHLNRLQLATAFNTQDVNISLAS